MGVGIFFYPISSQVRDLNEANLRKSEKGTVDMKELLKKIQEMEEQMNEFQQKADYWLEDEHFDKAMSNGLEKEADRIYESLYRLFDKAAENIVRITSGQVDKVTAMTMLRCRRSEVEEIFA